MAADKQNKYEARSIPATLDERTEITQREVRIGFLSDVPMDPDYFERVFETGLTVERDHVHSITVIETVVTTYTRPKFRLDR